MDLITATPTQLLAVATSTATATCTTAVPDKFGYVPPTSCNANYGFYPKWQDNMAFAIAFGLTTMVHVVQAVKFKKVRLLRGRGGRVGRCFTDCRFW